VSAAPAAFSRDAPTLIPMESELPFTPKEGGKRARKLQPHQYISITVTSSMGEGAVGLLHGGILRCFDAKSDKTMEAKVVLKMVFDEEKKVKLRHEYSVYQRLVAAGVEGIPSVFGMFQDYLEDGPLIMIVTDCGRNTWQCRRASPDSLEVVLSDEETCGLFSLSSCLGFLAHSC
jgi:hypothetical protein